MVPASLAGNGSSVGSEAHDNKENVSLALIDKKEQISARMHKLFPSCYISLTGISRSGFIYIYIYIYIFG